MSDQGEKSFQLGEFDKVRIEITYRITDDTASEYYRCHWIDSLCICWISISLLHGVFQKASYRSRKATPTAGHFSRSLYKHWFSRRRTRPSNLHQEVIYFECRFFSIMCTVS